jgi:malate synthase
LLVRPRGWHLPEQHVRGATARRSPAALFDFGLYFFHNARELLARGTGPYFYLPKLESHLEARLWNDVFVWAQEALWRCRAAPSRRRCLIETLPAAFEMDEILWELREHSAGLNCGRWDYIFSFIKNFRNDLRWRCCPIAPGHDDQPFMRRIRSCWCRPATARGVHAMGGMAAQIPIKNDPGGQRGGRWPRCGPTSCARSPTGHDGTWVAHPAWCRWRARPSSTST